MFRTYLITFVTYGSWLPGDVRGWVDDGCNDMLEPPRTGSPSLEACGRGLMSQDMFLLNPRMAPVVQRAMEEVCKHLGWTLHAVNVRTNHVHALVGANVLPERVMNDFKAYATRSLREAGLIGADRRVWARHGSTRWIDTDRSFELAKECVVKGQGAPLT